MSEGKGLPKGWVACTLGDIYHDKATTITPSTLPTEEFELYSVPSHPTGIAERALGSSVGSSKQTVDPGTVLLCKINPRINRTWVVPAKSGLRQIASTEWITFFPVEGLFPRFLGFYLQQNRIRDFLASNASGVGGSLMRVKPSTLQHFPFVLPPVPEQHRIVEKIEELFSDLDAGVASLERAKANLKRYRASALKSAVEGRLTDEWRKTHPQTEDGQMLLDRILRERREKWEKDQLAHFKKKGKEPPKSWQSKYEEPSAPDTGELHDLPEGWVYCTLEQIYESKKKGTRTGPFGTLLNKHEHQTQGVPVIGIENIGEMEFHQGSKIHITEAKAKELEDYDLVPGDIVISRSGTVGEVCVIPADIAQARMSTNLMRIRLYPNGVTPLYFCLLLHGSPFVKRQIHSLCSGSTRDFLNTEILKMLVFPVPPPAEQAEVLGVVEERLSQIDSAEKTIDAELIRAKRLRQSILKQAFEGKLVPQDPKDEPASVLLERIKAKREQEQPKKAKKVKAK
jgi:type I restriction enzyme S subunit